MAEQKLEDGDLFESANAEWIRATFPLYESVWARFIGHDSKGAPIANKKLSGASATDRQLFAQAHYSSALFSFLLNQLTEEAIAGLQESVADGTHRTAAAYLRDTRNFTLFVTLVGQICDQIEQMSASLDDPDIAKKIIEFGKERSHAIHAARIPMQYDSLGLKIATIAKLDPKAGEWDKGITWDMVDVTRFNYLEDWMRETRTDLFSTIRKPVYHMISKAAEKKFPHISPPPMPTFPSSSSTMTRPVSSSSQASDNRLLPPPSGKYQP